jgi:hypothetical protein
LGKFEIGGQKMFEQKVEKTNDALETRNQVKIDRMKKMQRDMAERFMSMQNVIATSLAGPQQAVDNAENYPSTWTTNPDGGANGQV